jgi:protein TonB
VTTLQKAFLLSFGIHLCLLGLWPNFRPPTMPDKKTLALANFIIEQAPPTVKAQTQKSLNTAMQENAFTEKKQSVTKPMPARDTLPTKKDSIQAKPQQAKPKTPEREHKNAETAFKKQNEKSIKQSSNKEIKKNVNKENPQSSDAENRAAVHKEGKGYDLASDHQTTSGNAIAAKTLPDAVNRQNILDAYRQKLAERLAKAKFYPTLAQRRGMEGKVMVRFVIDRYGNIQSVSVMESSGYAILDEAALEAVQSIGRFAPFPQEIPDPQWEITFAMVYQLTD